MNSLISMCFLFFILLLVGIDGFAPEFYQDSMQLDPSFKVYWNADLSESQLYLAFEVSTLGWIGFGLGEPDSGSMPGSDIVLISWESEAGQATLLDTYAMGFNRPLTDQCQSWNLISAEQVGSISIVEVSRPFDTQDAQDRVILPGFNRVIFAYGANTNLQVSYHRNRRGATQIAFFPNPNAPPMDDSSSTLIAEYLISNYNIPPQKTTYTCQSFPIPFSPGSPDAHVIRIDPIVNSKYAHHLLVYLCSNISATSYVNTYVTPSQCYSPLGNPAADCRGLLFEWAVGSQSLYLPEQAGYRIGYSPNAAQFLVLEMHYDNPVLLSSEYDISGFRIHYTTHLRQYDAGTLVIGDPLVSFSPIPPGISINPYQASCPSECTSKWNHGINVFADSLHMHSIGKMMWTTQYRDNELLRTTNRVEFFDFSFQQHSEVNYTILPGDLLNVHCVFDSTSRADTTRFASASSDEMCMNFLSYYPVLEANNMQNFELCGILTARKTGLANNISVCGSVAGLKDGSAFAMVNNPVLDDLSEGIQINFGKSPKACSALIHPTLADGNNTNSDTAGSRGKEIGLIVGGAVGRDRKSVV